jgi:hypothetical protein
MDLKSLKYRRLITPLTGLILNISEIFPLIVLVVFNVVLKIKSAFSSVKNYHCFGDPGVLSVR